MIRVYAVICEDPGGTDSLDHAVFHVQIRAEGLVIVDDLPALNQKAVALPETREDGSVFSTPSSSTLSRNFPPWDYARTPRPRSVCPEADTEASAATSSRDGAETRSGRTARRRLPRAPSRSRTRLAAA